MNTHIRLIFLFLAMSLLTACSKDGKSDDITGTTEWIKVKVAVIAPLSGEDGDEARYKRISKMFEENSIKAQHDWESGIRLELEWYDENTVDIYNLAETLCERKDIKAIIGPIKDNNVQIIANRLHKYSIPVFVISASEDIVRKYSSGTAGVKIKEPFLWSLCETDISQAQIMLYKIFLEGGRKVSLISSSGPYGDTWERWVPYHAGETGLQMVNNVQYSSKSELKTNIEEMLASDTDYIICALDDASDAKVVLESSQKKKDGPKLFFSGSIFKGDILSLGSLTEGMEGFSLYSSPNTGFQFAYTEKFGSAPKPYESQFYDALLLSLAAASHCHHTGYSITMNEALMSISDLPLKGDKSTSVYKGWGKGTPIWDHNHLRKMVLSPLRMGMLPENNLLGASGNLKFADDCYTSLVQSTYINWMVYNGKPVILDYVAMKGDRVTNYEASWGWQSIIRDEFKDEDVSIKYPDLDEKWAVLICSSEGWNNYRHQADLLNFYHFIKKMGMKDDRIILIMQDDIAYNQKNPYQGKISMMVGDVNLYQDFEMDYKIGDISPEDISDILLGRKSDRLPVVLESDENDNVLLYWTGHGVHQSFNWLETDKFTYDMLRDTFEQMSEEKQFRQLLMLAEPCYSGSMAKAAEGIPGILAISSADEFESSFADNYSRELGVWMCDRFTKNLVHILTDKPTIIYNDLYKQLHSSTMGSHVKIYNHTLFDNLYVGMPLEFYFNLNDNN